jgi:hypothetical protein
MLPGVPERRKKCSASRLSDGAERRERKMVGSTCDSIYHGRVFINCRPWDGTEEAEGHGGGVLCNKHFFLSASTLEQPERVFQSGSRMEL